MIKQPFNQVTMSNKQLISHNKISKEDTTIYVENPNEGKTLGTNETVSKHSTNQ